MAKSAKKKRRWLQAAFLLIILISAVLAYILSRPIDLSAKRGAIESAVSSRINGSVTMGAITLRLLPSPHIRIDHLVIRDLKEPVIDAEAVKLNISLRPLFSKKILIESLIVESPEILFKRDKTGRINLLHILRERVLPIVLGAVFIRDAHMKVVDEVPGRGAVFELSGLDASVERSMRGFTYTVSADLAPAGKVSVSGEAVIDEGGPEFSGTLSAQGVEAGALMPYLEKSLGDIKASGLLYVDSVYSYSGKGILKGSLSYRDMVIEPWKGFSRRIGSKAGASGFELSWKDGEFALSIEDADLRVEDFSVSGSLGLRKAGGKGSIAIKASTTAMPCTTLMDFVTPFLKDSAKRFFSRVKITAGDVAIKEFMLSGTFERIRSGAYFNDPESFRMALKVERAEFSHPLFIAPFYGVKGTMLLQGGGITVEHATGMMLSSNIQDFNCDFRNLAGGLTGGFSLKGGVSVEELLDQIRSIFKEDERALAVLNPLGMEGRGELGLTMEWKRPKAPPSYSMVLNLKGAELSYIGLPVTFSSLYGEVSVDEKELRFSGLRGGMSGTVFKLRGLIKRYRSPEPSIYLKVQSRISPPVFKVLVTGSALEELRFDSPLPVKGTLSGSPSRLVLEALVDCSNTTLSFRRYIDKEKGLTAGIEAKVVIRKRGGMDIEEAYIRFGRSAVSVTGNLSDAFDSYSLEIISKDVRTNDLARISPYLRSGFVSGGGISFNLKVKKERKEPHPSYKGIARFREGTFSTPLVAKPVKGLNAEVEFSGNRARLDIEGMSIGDSFIEGRVEVKDISKRLIEFTLSSDRLNLEDIRGPAPGGEESERTYIPLTGHGTMKVKVADILGHKIKNLSMDIELKKEAAVFDPLRFEAHGGTGTAKLLYFRDPGSPKLFDLKLDLYSLDSSSIIRELGAKKKILEGKLYGRVELSLKRGVEPSSRGLNGRAALSVEKGRLWKFIVMSKIFSIVNILSIDELFKTGMPFKFIKGDFTIKDGVLSTENLLLESDSMRMSAIGSIDLPTATIDAKLGMHPFVTVDKIISNIPLAGWIITGKEKSTVSMYYNLTGPVRDPDVDPIPLRGMSERVIGVFQRLLEAPVRVLEPKGKRE